MLESFARAFVVSTRHEQSKVLAISLLIRRVSQRLVPKRAQRTVAYPYASTTLTSSVCSLGIFIIFSTYFLRFSLSFHLVLLLIN